MKCDCTVLYPVKSLNLSCRRLFHVPHSPILIPTPVILPLLRHVQTQRPLVLLSLRSLCRQVVEVGAVENRAAHIVAVGRTERLAIKIPHRCVERLVPRDDVLEGREMELQSAFGFDEVGMFCFLERGS